MVDTFLFPQQRRVQRSNLMLDATIRDFSGGWNVIDNDLNLSTKFSVKLRNMTRNKDGSNGIRQGTKLFADTSAVLDSIVNVEYFSGNIIAVGANGKLAKIDGAGNVSEIWSDDWADNLPGNPSGWSATTFASFAIFNGALIVCNGVNKPLIIDSSINCQYLTDPATGSNANTPIGKYVKAHARYLVIAGDPNAESTIYISSTDTSGVFVGDDAPNDAVNINLGSRVPSGSPRITGLGSFRTTLLTFFTDATLPGTLGVFDSDGNHTPTIADSMEGFGSISHRVIQTVGEDVFFADTNGVAAISRALFTGATEPDRISQLIDPEVQFDINQLKFQSTLEDRTFSIYDSQNDDYMLFIPDNDVVAGTVETHGFVHKRNKPLKIDAWYEFRNWKWTAGCRSALKRIFFTRGTEVFIYGNEQDEVTKDFVGSEEMWDDDMPWSDGTGWSPVADVANSGVPIPWIWELPWTDAGQRFLTKQSRYINFDTLGDQQFSCAMFIDNIYDDRNFAGETWDDGFLFDDDLGWEAEQLDPAISMTFNGGDAPGYGNDEYGNLYGGGRPTRLEKLYNWPSRYKLSKLRFSGDATEQLRFVSITLGYLQGSPRRA
jgi:hypothetical protein